MKQIFDSNYYGDDDSAERIYVYALESIDEFWELQSMSHNEKCELFGVFDESGYEVMPGAIYYTYTFDVSLHFITMCETMAINV